jgi:phenylpropionate dioxygenase-like ring-hydroxylating dioxygenase large terminal subunit
MPLAEGRGNTRRLTCSYHAWTYALDGKLLRAPEIEPHRADFLRDCRLPQFPCETWHGFVFVNLDADAAPFVDSPRMRAVEPMVANLHVDDMRLIFSAEQEWDANWKCLVENFLEGYHLSVVHRRTLKPYTPTRLARHFQPGDGYFGFYSYYPEDAPSRGDSHPDLSEEERRRSLMLGIAPCSVFGMSGFKVTYNLIQPLSATRLRTKIGMIGIPPRNDAEREQAEAGSRLFQNTFAEDEAQLVKLMRGLKSRAYQSSILARPDYEGPIWDFYNYLARRLHRET